jgi:hypothetical protein
MATASFTIAAKEDQLAGLAQEAAYQTLQAKQPTTIALLRHLVSEGETPAQIERFVAQRSTPCIANLFGSAAAYIAAHPQTQEEAR